MTTHSSPLDVKPFFRIQVLFENEVGSPIKEFKVGDLSEATFDALVTKVFAMSFPKEHTSEYNVTFKYRHLEEHDESRWIDFDNTERFGYAIQSNEHKGYVFIAAYILKKGAVAPVVVSPPRAVAACSTKAATKPKVAKKTKSVKAKAPSRSSGHKMSVDQKIITALKELFDLGITAPPRLQVALFSGYGNVKSKSFANALSKLAKTQGLIEYPDKKTVRLTAAGIAKAGTVSPPTRNEEVHEKIKNLLKGTETKIFNELVDGCSHEREQVATSIGFSNIKSKSFANSLSKMSSLGFLEYVKDEISSKKNMIRLTDIAFPLGRPGSSDTSTYTMDTFSKYD